MFLSRGNATRRSSLAIHWRLPITLRSFTLEQAPTPSAPGCWHSRISRTARPNVPWRWRSRPRRRLDVIARRALSLQGHGRKRVKCPLAARIRRACDHRDQSARRHWASPLLQVLVEPTQPPAVEIARTDGVAGTPAEFFCLWRPPPFWWCLTSRPALLK